MRKLLVALMVTAGGLLAGTPAMAQSFDCSTVTGADEQTICASRELSDLDTAMAESFEELIRVMRRRGRSADIADLRQDQRNWLADRRRCGRNRACLRDSYENRDTYLRQLINSYSGRAG